jgi:hypothetical protein
LKQLPPPDPRGRRTFLWVIAAFCLLFAIVIATQIAKVISFRSRIIGDGTHVESYKFDLSNLSVPAKLVVTAGGPRDSQRPLVNPKIGDAATLEKLNARNRSKYLTSDDPVVGVTIGNESRVYPVYILRWHEIINDTLGGVPIAVTYSPLCDSAVVFDRRLDGSDKPLTFGYSGLLYNSNLLMYDRREDGQVGGESLWSQMKFEAISGPSVGKKLKVLPMFFGKWSQWHAAQPNASGLLGMVDDPAYREKYRGGNEMSIGPGTDPYRHYFEAKKLRFPVEPLVPADSALQPFDRVTAVATAEPDHWMIMRPEDAAAQSLSPSKAPEDQLGVSSAPAIRPSVHTCYFAWYAMHAAPK